MKLFHNDYSFLSHDTIVIHSAKTASYTIARIPETGTLNADCQSESLKFSAPSGIATILASNSRYIIARNNRLSAILSVVPKFVNDNTWPDTISKDEVQHYEFNLTAPVLTCRFDSTFKNTIFLLTNDNNLHYYILCGSDNPKKIAAIQCAAVEARQSNTYGFYDDDIESNRIIDFDIARLQNVVDDVIILTTYHAISILLARITSRRVACKLIPTIALEEHDKALHLTDIHNVMLITKNNLIVITTSDSVKIFQLFIDRQVAVLISEIAIGAKDFSIMSESLHLSKLILCTNEAIYSVDALCGSAECFYKKRNVGVLRCRVHVDPLKGFTLLAHDGNEFQRFDTKSLIKSTPFTKRQLFLEVDAATSQASNLQRHESSLIDVPDLTGTESDANLIDKHLRALKDVIDKIKLQTLASSNEFDAKLKIFECQCKLIEKRYNKVVERIQALQSKQKEREELVKSIYIKIKHRHRDSLMAEPSITIAEEKTLHLVKRVEQRCNRLRFETYKTIKCDIDTLQYDIMTGQMKELKKLTTPPSGIEKSIVDLSRKIDRKIKIVEQCSDKPQIDSKSMIGKIDSQTRSAININ